MHELKIAMVGQRGIPATYGGVEKHTEEIATRMAAKGHKITVYCRSHYSSTNTSGYYKGIKIVSLPVLKQRNLEMISHTFLAMMHSVILDNKVDIMHIQSVDPGILSLIPRLKAKVVITSHGWAYKTHNWNNIFKWASILAEKVFVSVPDRRIAVSKTLKKYYEEKYKCEVDYIPNGVELANVKKFCVPRFELKNHNDQKDNIELHRNNYFVYIGRILPLKGVDILTEAWKKVKSDKKLVIVGGSSYTDDYVKSLKKSADKRTLFVGYRYGDELKRLYANAYCCIIPSRVEGLAITLLEAMSYGKCVIYSDIPENVEAAEGVGISFRNKDVDDLAEKMRFALENPEYCQELGAKARKRVKEEYNWDKIVDQTEEVYYSLFR